MEIDMGYIVIILQFVVFASFLSFIYLFFEIKDVRSEIKYMKSDIKKLEEKTFNLEMESIRKR